MEVLYEDNHLLVISKPAGLLAQGDASQKASLVDVAKQYRKEREQKPGNVYVGLVHRLDQPVTGVIVLAKTSKAAARLSKQFRDREVEKVYFAVVSMTSRSAPLPPTDSFEDWRDEIDVESDGSPSRRQSCHCQCRLRKRSGNLALLELRPFTGRKRQLRIQTSRRGLPIVGDDRFDSTMPFSDGIALHAASLRIAHPTLGEMMTFTAPPPHSWAVFPFSANEFRLHGPSPDSLNRT